MNICIVYLCSSNKINLELILDKTNIVEEFERNGERKKDMTIRLVVGSNTLQEGKVKDKQLI